MLVEIKPLDVKKWHGKKGKESFAQPHVLEVLFDSKTGKYATGMTDEEATEYSKRTGYDLSNIYNQNEAHPFWSTAPAMIKLPNNTMILDTQRDMDFIKYKNLLASKYVANSIREWEEGQWPEATHVIYDEDQENEVKATKAERKQEIYSKLAKADDTKKASIIKIVGEKSVMGKSHNFIVGEIEELIETKPEEVLRWLKMDDKKTYLRATILEALSRNILTRDGMSIFYMGEFVAGDLEGAITYFEDPNNSTFKATILGKLK